MNQLSIFEAPAARSSDPETSHQAAAQAVELQAKHHRLILACLSEHGPMGKDGIAARVRGLDGVAVCRRLTELERTNRIRLTGRVVKSTSGRNEREWAIA